MEKEWGADSGATRTSGGGRLGLRCAGSCRSEVPVFVVKTGENRGFREPVPRSRGPWPEFCFAACLRWDLEQVT